MLGCGCTNAFEWPVCVCSPSNGSQMLKVYFFIRFPPLSFPFHFVVIYFIRWLCSCVAKKRCFYHLVYGTTLNWFHFILDSAYMNFSFLLFSIYFLIYNSAVLSKYNAGEQYMRWGFFIKHRTSYPSASKTNVGKRKRETKENLQRKHHIRYGSNRKNIFSFS